jgi:hypothetical protein
MKSYLIILLSTIFVATLGCNKPRSYDDCILENVKENMNKRAVNAVVKSCRKKFPKDEEGTGTKVSSRNLNSYELEKLTGRAGYSYGFLDGSLYNGNEGIVVTEVEINVTTTSEDEEVTRSYSVDDLHIEPKSTSSFIFSIISGDQGADYSWYIVSAKGR